MIIGIMKVRNEEDILPLMLEKSKWLDGLVVLDNGSTDKTSEILKACPSVLDYIYDDRLFDEKGMSRQLLEIAMKYNPDWIAEVDADEIFDDKINEIMKSDLSAYNTIAYDIHYMIGDKEYKTCRGWQRIYRNLGTVITNSMKKNQTLHWGKNPIPKDLRKIYYKDIQVKHYHIRSYEQGMRKYNRYLELDPDLKYQPKGYEHIKFMANAIRTKDFSGINFKNIE